MEAGHGGQVEMLMVVAEQTSYWAAKRIGIVVFLAIVKHEVWMRPG